MRAGGGRRGRGAGRGARAVPPVREQVDEGWRAYLRVAVENAQLRLAGARTEAEPLRRAAGRRRALRRRGAAARRGARPPRPHRRSRRRCWRSRSRSIRIGRSRSPSSRPTCRGDRRGAAGAGADPAAAHRDRAGGRADPRRRRGRRRGRRSRSRSCAASTSSSRARRCTTRPCAASRSRTPRVGVARARSATTTRVRLAAGAERGLAEPAAQALSTRRCGSRISTRSWSSRDTTRRGGPTLLVQRCAGAPARCSAVVEIGYGDRAGLAAAARAAWEAARAGELRYPPSVLGDRGGRRDGKDRCKVCRSPWLWTGVGAAVVGGRGADDRRDVGLAAGAGGRRRSEPVLIGVQTARRFALRGGTRSGSAGQSGLRRYCQRPAAKPTPCETWSTGKIAHTVGIAAAPSLRADAHRLGAGRERVGRERGGRERPQRRHARAARPRRRSSGTGAAGAASGTCRA